MENVKVGDTIIRPVTNAKREVLALLNIKGTDYIVSQYFSSNSPRIDSVAYLLSMEYRVK